MLIDEKIECWNGDIINIQVEDRYISSGEILLNLEDSIDYYTESLTLENLIELREKIDKTICVCQNKNNDRTTKQQIYYMFTHDKNIEEIAEYFSSENCVQEFRECPEWCGENADCHNCWLKCLKAELGE